MDILTTDATGNMYRGVFGKAIHPLLSVLCWVSELWSCEYAW